MLKMRNAQMLRTQQTASSFEHVDPTRASDAVLARRRDEFANCVLYSIGRNRRWERIDDWRRDATTALVEETRFIASPQSEMSHLRADQDESSRRRRAAREAKQRRRAAIEAAPRKRRRGLVVVKLRPVGKKGTRRNTTNNVTDTNNNDNANTDTQPTSSAKAKRLSATYRVYLFAPSAAMRAPRVPTQHAVHSSIYRHRDELASNRRCVERSILAGSERRGFDLRPNEKPIIERKLGRLSRVISRI